MATHIGYLGNRHNTIAGNHSRSVVQPSPLRHLPQGHLDNTNWLPGQHIYMCVYTTSVCCQVCMYIYIHTYLTTHTGYHDNTYINLTTHTGYHDNAHVALTTQRSPIADVQQSMFPLHRPPGSGYLSNTLRLPGPKLTRHKTLADQHPPPVVQEIQLPRVAFTTDTLP